jgi:hypothetical protein
MKSPDHSFAFMTAEQKMDNMAIPMVIPQSPARSYASSLFRNRDLLLNKEPELMVD